MGDTPDLQLEAFERIVIGLPMYEQLTQSGKNVDKWTAKEWKSLLNEALVERPATTLEKWKEMLRERTDSIPSVVGIPVGDDDEEDVEELDSSTLAVVNKILDSLKQERVSSDARVAALKETRQGQHHSCMLKESKMAGKRTKVLEKALALLNPKKRKRRSP